MGSFYTQRMVRPHSGKFILSFLVLTILCDVAVSQNAPRTVHVFVALADNVNQGIVPVPPRLGNGLDPARNLYWGAAAGVKTFFSGSADWSVVQCVQKPKPAVLERCIFKHKTATVYLVADAYRGNEIRQAILDFLDAASGANREPIAVTGGLSISAYGASNLVAYVGHDGLMDFRLPLIPRQKNPIHRDAIILACASKQYFSESLRTTGAQPLLWTTGLMAPEAYTLKAAIDGWISRESAAQIHERAAAAYDKYQKCGMKAARHLFATGW